MLLITELLVRGKGSTYLSGWQGVYPLAIAAAYRRTEILDLLFSTATEMQIDIQEDMDEALIQTFEGEDLIMEWLIAHGASVNPRPNAVCSPLVAACVVSQQASRSCRASIRQSGLSPLFHHLCAGILRR